MSCDSVISDVIIYLFPYTEPLKIAAARRPARRVPGDLVEAAARLVQIREDAIPPARPPPRPSRARATARARLFEQRRVPHVRDRRTIAQDVAAPRDSTSARAARRGPRRSATTPQIAPALPRSHARGKIALLATTTRGRARGLVEQRAIVVASAARERSSTTISMSAAAPAWRARAMPSSSTASPARSRRPAVSTSVNGTPSMSTRSVSRSRVVPGTSVTIARPRRRAG